ncbi:carboxypeptidase-like regulatory domain-containing protein [Maribacter litopenaei]|uniref:Carboxypeptidase-like regulatory domain-containing protein n=1 Tax=Maribacter litopenaei TaxID=2976127 RepID=A0ABY5Y829_9FLAO|nr:carboxypeptidase-like regulatory domain-containing protein [Maribacter litopenaei]UWX55180.1 carboxypeptidase-like regulatory domain-containing protein [Maribacter litopenaei]
MRIFLNYVAYCLRKPIGYLAIIMIICTASSTVMTAQTTVSGTVTSAADGMPLPGVSIIDANNPTRGVQADFDGNYSITLDDGNTSLRFSYIGFKTVVVPLNNQTTLNVSLEEDVANLEEVVVVGYGTRKKATVTGAVTAVQDPYWKAHPQLVFPTH